MNSAWPFWAEPLGGVDGIATGTAAAGLAAAEAAGLAAEDVAVAGLADALAVGLDALEGAGLEEEPAAS